MQFQQSKALRRAAFGLVLATGVVALTACGGATNPSAGSSAGGGSGSGSVTIGFSPYNQSAPALVGLGKGVTGYAASKGAKTLIADPNNSATKQVQQIRSWMQLGQVKALWTLALNPQDMKALIPVAQQKKVGLVTTGKPSDYGLSSLPKSVSFSIIDYPAFGKAMGEQLGKCANDRLGGKGVFLYLTNSPGSTGKADEDAAVVAALKATSPGSKIVATLDNQGDRLKSQQATLSTLQSHPDLNGTVGGIDEATMGPVTAFTQTSKDPTKACIVGAGGSPEALAAVKARKVYSDVAINFDADLKQTVDETVRLAKDPTATGKQLYTPFAVVSK